MRTFTFHKSKLLVGYFLIIFYTQTMTLGPIDFATAYRLLALSLAIGAIIYASRLPSGITHPPTAALFLFVATSFPILTDLLRQDYEGAVEPLRYALIPSLLVFSFSIGTEKKKSLLIATSAAIIMLSLACYNNNIQAEYVGLSGAGGKIRPYFFPTAHQASITLAISLLILTSTIPKRLPFAAFQYLLIAVGGILIIQTGVRLGLVALIIAITINSFRSRKSAISTALITTCMAAFVVLVAPEIIDRLGDRTFTTVHDNRTFSQRFASGRLWIWQAHITYMLENFSTANWIIGIGFSEMRGAVGGAIETKFDAHSGIIGMLTYYGIMGLVYLAAFYYIVIRLLSAHCREKTITSGIKVIFLMNVLFQGLAPGLEFAVLLFILTLPTRPNEELAPDVVSSTTSPQRKRGYLEQFAPNAI